MRPFTIPHGGAYSRPGRFTLIGFLVMAIAAPAAGDRVDRQARREERRNTLDAWGRGEFDLPSPYWREGPVRYLLSKDEDGAFREARTSGERERYITRFWVSRDPDPTGPGNRFRDIFYRRVSEANQYFAGTTKPGWKTDRGKIFIMLGPPDERDERLLGLIRALILWTYRDPPEGSTVSPNSTIRFVRDHSGEFRLSSSVRLSSTETALSIGLQMQAMQVESVPEPRELLDTVVNMEAPTVGAPFRTHHDFFGAGGTDTIVVLTLGARESLLTDDDSDRADSSAGTAAPPGGPRFEAIARLVGDDPDGRTYDLAGVTGLRSGTGDLALDDDGYRLFQGGATIAPGTYTIHFGVVDLHSGRIHTVQDRIEVPAFDSNRIAVSSITLASRLERLPGRTTFGYSAPFVFGDLRAVPRADDILDGDDELLIYYQVYGAAIDAIGGRPDFDLEYRVLAALSAGPDGDPIFSPFGHPIHLTHLHNPVQGYSFSLAGWPPAAYLLEVEALDNYTGQRSSSRVAFLIR